MLGAVHAQLRGDEGLGPVGQQRGQRPGGPGHDLHQTQRRVRRIVEAEVAVGEEHVPAHLPGQSRVFAQQAVLDERVPGGGHDGSAAVLGDVGKEQVRAFHVADDGAAGLFGQHLPGEERQQTVAVDDPGRFVHRADAVAVAVEPDAQLGPVLEHRSLERGEVLLLHRVRVVVGKAAVRLAVKRNDLGPGALQQGLGHQPGRAVAAVEHHLDPAGELRQAGEGIEVAGLNVVRRGQAPALREIVRGQQPGHLLDLAGVDGASARPDLEAVVLRRVVAGGDHDPGVVVQMPDGEIADRGGHHAQKQHVHAGACQPGHQAVLEAGGGQAAVAPDNGPARAARQEIRPAGAAQLLHPVGVEVLTHNAPDVIGAKNALRVLVHGPLCRLEPALATGRCVFCHACVLPHVVVYRWYS